MPEFDEIVVCLYLLWIQEGTYGGVIYKGVLFLLVECFVNDIHAFFNFFIEEGSIATFDGELSFDSIFDI